jgi:transposase
VGAVTATAIVATVGHGTVLKNGRRFAPWRGLVPRQYATGGKPHLGHISTRGEGYWRARLIHGARRVLPCTGTRMDTKSRGAERLTQRRGNNIAAVALAATHARILCALLARDQGYRLAASRAKSLPC